MFWLSLIYLVYFLFLAIWMWQIERSIKSVDEVPIADIEWPKISMIVCARNEATSIEAALESQLHLDYPNYEVMVVNDRSTDRTGEILNQMTSRYPSLKVTNIDQLPEGWLGKCNAMHQGAMAATGDWILFADADVSMRPDTLKRAISFAQQEQADHIALAPVCILPGWWLQAFVATFVILFKLFVNPRQIARTNSKAHVGVGAFNLVRRSVYETIGGHEPIRLRPDDDLKLGKLIKKNGYRQRFGNGVRLISVPWYASVAEMIRGLEKNSYAGMEYSLAKLIGSNLILLAAFVCPFIGLFFASGLAFWMLLVACVLMLAIGASNAHAAGYQSHHGLFFPLGILVFIYVMNRAVFLTYKRNGIYWRDTFYSLDDLRSNVV
jgi:cellulose synthase/poly-beta-1,6-N-acetylglucosamine synthase-like glycosyltransferase